MKTKRPSLSVFDIAGMPHKAHLPAVNQVQCYTPSDPLITAREAAIERRQGLSTFWRDVKLGRIPDAFYVSPCAPRWRLSEIRQGIEATRGRAAVPRKKQK